MNFTSQIIQNPEGGTVALAWDEVPTAGYLVGGLVSPLVLDEQGTLADEREALDAFIEYINGPTVGAPFLGWWTDEETGKLYVDATTWHGTEFEAGRIGRERREIAIFDCQRRTSLYLTYVEGE
jgi:hypothetical protein